MYYSLISVLIVDIFNGYVLNICYVEKLVDMYLSEYVLMYSIKLIHLLLINISERDKFCS